MTRHPASLLVGALAVLAASCSQSSGLNATTPALPTGLSGSWTGALGGTTLVQVDLFEQPGMVQPPSGGFAFPGFLVSGSGFLTSGGCTQSVTVTGQGDGLDYSIQLVGSGTNTYVIELFAFFQEDATSNLDLLSGGFALKGLPSEACISGPSGLFELGRTALDGVEGTFNGTWTGADSISFRTSQTGERVLGAVRWSSYTCARDAFFSGLRTGDHVVGTLVPLFGSLTSYDVSFDWDSDAQTLDGSFAVSGSLPPSTCSVGGQGSFQLGSISSLESGQGGSAVSVTVLELGPGSEPPEVLLQLEERR